MILKARLGSTKIPEPTIAPIESVSTPSKPSDLRSDSVSSSGREEPLSMSATNAATLLERSG